MKNLRENGYIDVDSNGYITLLDSGKEIAEKMYERHTTLSNWLISIGVEPEIAVEDACKIEHIISAESFNAIKKLAE
jgi:Mn-dependent DtxR family transcriptional regulator